MQYVGIENNYHITFNVLENMKLNTYTPKADFNGMDCTDLVIGSARGSASRIWDYYTRDRYSFFIIIVS